jgi:hypothetical protein
MLFSLISLFHEAFLDYMGKLFYLKARLDISPSLYISIPKLNKSSISSSSTSRIVFSEQKCLSSAPSSEILKSSDDVSEQPFEEGMLLILSSESSLEPCD